MVIAIGAVVMSNGPVPPIYQPRPEVTATPNHVAITDGSGTSSVIHQFNPGAILGNAPTRVEDLDGDGAPDILAAVAHYAQDWRSIGGGELLALSIAGDVRWRFAFDDALTFAGGSVSGPWVIADWQAEPDRALKRIAISATEVNWWASLVAVLDHTGRRGNAFVNPGWIESVLWLSSDRLAVAGFYNPRDEGMFAMLDANRIGGQAPGTAGTEFACVTCVSATPLFYATFARSELNRVTGNRFNRARLSTSGDRIVVHTFEVVRHPNNDDATALYEFDRDLRFLRARYSDTYWDEHLHLEREGTLTHSRETCPDRDGPAAIHIWDAARGWTRTTPSGGG